MIIPIPASCVLTYNVRDMSVIWTVKHHLEKDLRKYLKISASASLILNQTQTHRLTCSIVVQMRS